MFLIHLDDISHRYFSDLKLTRVLSKNQDKVEKMCIFYALILFIINAFYLIGKTNFLFVILLIFLLYLIEICSDFFTYLSAIEVDKKEKKSFPRKVKIFDALLFSIFINVFLLFKLNVPYKFYMLILSIIVVSILVLSGLSLSINIIHALVYTTLSNIIIFNSKHFFC